MKTFLTLSLVFFLSGFTFSGSRDINAIESKTNGQSNCITYKQLIQSANHHARTENKRKFNEDGIPEIITENSEMTPEDLISKPLEEIALYSNSVTYIWPDFTQDEYVGFGADWNTKSIEDIDIMLLGNLVTIALRAKETKNRDSAFKAFNTLRNTVNNHVAWQQNQYFEDKKNSEVPEKSCLTLLYSLFHGFFSLAKAAYERPQLTKQKQE